MYMAFKTRPSPRSKIGINAGGAHFLQLYRKNKYGDSYTLEPRYSEGPRDWQKYVPYNEVSLYRGSLIFIYFPSKCWGKQNRSLYPGLRYIEVLQISRFHCI